MTHRRCALRAAFLLLAAFSLLTLPGLGAALPPQPVDSDSIVRFEGEIEALGPLYWTISGSRVYLHPETPIDQEAGTPKIGAWVIVEATQRPDGRVWANAIRVLVGASEPGPLSEFTGLIEVVSDLRWVVGGVEVLIIPRTVISGEPKRGLPAHVRARRQDQSWWALHITVLPSAAEGEVVQFEGIIQSLGPSRWVVGAQAVQVDEFTVIVGEPAPGRSVEVTAVLEVGGRLRGEHLRVLPEDGDHSGTFGGLIIEIAGSEEEQRWRILRLEVGLPASEEIVRVDGTALVDQSRGLAAPGLWAEVIAERGSEDGVRARRIRIERPVGVNLTGTIQVAAPAVPGWWQVGGQCVYVHAKTAILGTPLPGERVQVEGLRLGSGCIWAEKVRPL